MASSPRESLYLALVFFVLIFWTSSEGEPAYHVSFTVGSEDPALDEQKAVEWLKAHLASCAVETVRVLLFLFESSLSSNYTPFIRMRSNNLVMLQHILTFRI